MINHATMPTDNKKELSRRRRRRRCLQVPVNSDWLGSPPLSLSSARTGNAESSLCKAPACIVCQSDQDAFIYSCPLPLLSSSAALHGLLTAGSSSTSTEQPRLVFDWQALLTSSSVGRIMPLCCLLAACPIAWYSQRTIVIILALINGICWILIPFH